MNKTLKIIIITIVVLVGLGIAGLYAVKTQFNGAGVHTGYEDEMGMGGMAMPDINQIPRSPMAADSFRLSPGTYNQKSEEMASESSPINDQIVTTDKKIIKNGNLSFKVDNVDKAAEDIGQIAKANEGDVFSTNFYQSGKNIKMGTITVKVPVKNFEKAVGDLKRVASLVLRESTSGSDVTEQYVDLQAQLKNKKAEEEAYLKILNQAQKIEDILSVQMHLSQVRGEIERLQGRVKFLESQTDMATITLSLSEDANIAMVDRWRPLQVAKVAINDLVKKIQEFIDFTIRLIITIIPVLILYGILVLIVYKVGKKLYLKFWKKDQV